MPLIILASLIAFHGILALIFEVQFLLQNSFEVYLTRLFTVVTAFTILVFSQTQIGKKKPLLFLHLLFLVLNISFGFVVYTIPASFNINSFILAFVLVLAAYIIGWKSRHQIIIVLTYLVVFGFLFFATHKIGAVDRATLIQISAMFMLALLSIFGNLFVNNMKSKLNSRLTIKKPLTDNISDDVFKNMFEQSAEGLFQTAPDGGINLVNQALAKILGYESQEEIYEIGTIEKFYKNIEDREKLKVLLERQGRVKNYRITLIKKDGSEIIVRLNNRVIYNENREPKLYEGSLQDITPLVRKEIESRQAYEKLRQEKLSASNEVSKVKQSSDFKTQFLANMSHEIRTPMNSVLGFLTLIENELYEDPDELKEFANNAHQAAESLLDIINNILDISKVEAGKLELEEKDFSLKDEIDKVVSMVSPNAQEKKLSISVGLSENLPAIVTGDSTRYRQILVNLVGNAIKFTETGGIKIKADIVGDQVKKIRTSVIDTGKGIPEDKIESLFRPYFQLKEKNIEKPQGTGLGLMIAKEFTNLMGGEIQVKSKVGEGTIFTFTVLLKFEGNESIEPSVVKEPPAEKAGEPTIEENDIKEEVVFPKTPGTQSGKKRLLLVEDNPISQKVELRILREVGYLVDPVSNGLDAIEAVKTGNFDLVLMDIEMAEMDGLTATKKIRNLDGEVSLVPIIAVTANSSMKDREKCLAAGMDDYIAKPININFLKMTIDRWLKEER